MTPFCPHYGFSKHRVSCRPARLMNAVVTAGSKINIRGNPASQLMSPARKGSNGLLSPRLGSRFQCLAAAVVVWRAGSRRKAGSIRLSRFANAKPGMSVQLQQFDGRSSNRRKSDDAQAIPFKMLLPAVATRVKQRRHLARVGVDPRQVTSFVQVTLCTSQREIVSVVGAAMFSRNDLLNLERDQRRGRLRALAIFATILCSCAHCRP